jgi:hypothetical protein
LTPVQKKLILPRYNAAGNYDDMDITLLYTLLRNIANIPPHNNGWGNDPDPLDRSVAANIERIRLVRNRCVHSSDPFIRNVEFKTIWSEIRSTMVDLDTFLKKKNQYEKAVDLLRHESMDPDLDVHYEKEYMKQVVTGREMCFNLKRTARNHN